MITTILFDLDGTLLPIDTDEFTRLYFKALYSVCSMGVDQESYINAVWAGTRAMVQNDGSATNEARFWQVFPRIINKDEQQLRDLTMRFYQNEFIAVKSAVKQTPFPAKTVSLLKRRGYKLVLATNPIFPDVATFERMGWVGLCKDDFSYISTYENSNYCKPNKAYYSQVLQNSGAKADQCLMIGNDASEDLAAQKVGISCCLVNDFLINKENVSLSGIPVYNYCSLYDFALSMPDLSLR